jgi:NADH:ubiquinone oxidoreductase subunit 3 (subunit A)
MSFLVCALLLAGVLGAASWLFAPAQADPAKSLPYECGFSPVTGDRSAAFPVAFYLVGLLFMLFDLEILLLYPVGGGSLAATSLEGAGAALVFLVFSVGFVVEVRSGGLQLAG